MAQFSLANVDVFNKAIDYQEDVERVFYVKLPASALHFDTISRGLHCSVTAESGLLHVAPAVHEVWRCLTRMF